MITYKQLERVRKANARLSDNTKKKITEVIERTKPQGEDALRRAILEELAPVMAEADEIAAQMSAAMYNGWRFAALGLTTDTVTQSAYDQKKVEAMANTAAKAAREGETVEAVINIVNGRASYDIRKSYGDTMIANAGRDKHEVRFARIPGTSEHYADGCPFCRMLASRGFVYYSKSTAGEFSHYHDGCTCEPVAQFDKNPKVEGYDPDAYYDEYLAARDYAKTHFGDKYLTADDIAKAYRELGNAGRAASDSHYGRSIGAKKLIGYQDYLDTVESIEKPKFRDAKQKQHIKGTKEYLDRLANDEVKGYFIDMPYSDLLKMIEENIGKGEPAFRPDGTWKNLEVVEMDFVVGYAYNISSGLFDPVHGFTIRYSKSKGIHAVPKFLEDVDNVTQGL